MARGTAAGVEKGVCDQWRRGSAVDDSLSRAGRGRDAVQVNLLRPLLLLEVDDLMIFAVILMGCSSCRLSRRKQGLFGAGQAKSWRMPRYCHRISARRTSPSASSPIARFVHRLSSLSCILVHTTPPSAALLSPAPYSHHFLGCPALPPSLRSRWESIYIPDRPI